MTRSDWQWLVLADPQAVAHAAARAIGDAAAAAIDARGAFRLVLAGGRTPATTYDLLARQSQEWARWQFYFGDERCLPVHHFERNSAMARQALFDPVPVRERQIHAIPAEQGAQRAARLYAEVVEPALPFDLVILGIGEDGHTASLFPGRPLDPEALTVAVADAPKLPRARVSLGLRALTASRQLLVLATGEGKRWALQAWQADVDLPITRVCAAHPALVLLDRAAAGDGVDPTLVSPAI